MGDILSAMIVYGAAFLCVSFVWGAIGVVSVATFDIHLYRGIIREWIDAAPSLHKTESRLFTCCMLWPLIILWFGKEYVVRRFWRDVPPTRIRTKSGREIECGQGETAKAGDSIDNVWIPDEGYDQMLPLVGSKGHFDSIDCWCIPRVVRLCPQCDGQDGGCPRCEFDEGGLANVTREEYHDPDRTFETITIHNEFQ